MANQHLRHLCSALLEPLVVARLRLLGTVDVHGHAALLVDCRNVVPPVIVRHGGRCRAAERAVGRLHKERNRPWPARDTAEPKLPAASFTCTPAPGRNSSA